MQTMNKQQFICRRIAIELLMMHMEGRDRLRSVKQYAQEYGVGSGTVQGAFQTLKDMGAVQLNACGASGTYLAEVNQRKLFDACGYDELICLMPLDANLQVRSLATGIYEAVSSRGLPIHMLFARGSRNRSIMVGWGKGDFAVMSRLAYDTALLVGDDAIDLVDTVGLYPGEIGVITRQGQSFDPAVTPVAFDRYAYDHRAVHRLMNLQPSPRTDCLDVQLPHMVRQGQIPAALCRCFGPQEGLCFHPLTLPPAEAQRLHQAVLVTRRDEEALCSLLRCIVSCSQVTQIQDQVIAGKRMVKY